MPFTSDLYTFVSVTICVSQPFRASAGTLLSILLTFEGDYGLAVSVVGSTSIDWLCIAGLLLS